MANPEHVAVVRLGWKALAAWRSEHPEVCLDLSGARIRSAPLFRADLRNANLSGVDLTGVDLYGTDFSDANLSGANLARADLRWTYFDRANLSGVNFTGALRPLYPPSGWVVNAKGRLDREGGADLSGASLFGADLTGADLGI